MAALSDLLLRLDVDSAQFRAELDKAGREVGNFAAKVTRAADLVVGFITVEAVKAGAEALFEFTKAGAEAAEQMSQLAVVTGLSVEQISALSYSAAVSGVAFQSLNEGVQTLTRAQLRAAEGSQQQRVVFDLLHVSYQNANGTLRNTSDVMLDLSAKLAVMKDGAEKTALAQVLFRGATEQLLPWLNLGPAAIKANEEEARKLGLTLENGTVVQSKAYLEVLARLHLLQQGVAQQLVKDLAPAFTRVVDVLMQSASGADHMRVVLGPLEAFLKVLASGVIRVTGDLDYFGKRLAEVAAIGNALVHGRLKEAKAIFLDAEADIKGDIEANNRAIAALWDKRAEDAKKGIAPQQTQEGPHIPELRKGNITKAEQGIDAARAKSALELIRELFREQDAIEADHYKSGLTSLQAYYEAQEVIANTASKAEVSVLRTQLREEEALHAKTIKAKDLAGQYQTQAKIVEINGQIALAELKRYDEANARAREYQHLLELQRVALQDIAIGEQDVAGKQGITAQLDALRQSRDLLLTTDAAYYAKLRSLEQQSYEQDKAIEEAKLQNHLNSLTEDQQQRELEIAASHARIEAMEGDHQEKLKNIDREAQKARAEFALEAEHSILSSMSSDLASVIDGSKSVASAMHDLVASIISDIAKMEADNLVKMLFGSGTGGGNFLGGALSMLTNWGPSAAPAGGTTDFSQWNFLGLPHRAAGGMLGIGELSVVGEKGPELFMPNVGGAIVPNDQVRSALGGKPSGGASTLQVVLHPEAMQMTMRDWLEGELALMAATR